MHFDVGQLVYGLASFGHLPNNTVLERRVSFCAWSDITSWLLGQLHQSVDLVDRVTVFVLIAAL